MDAATRARQYEAAHAAAVGRIVGEVEAIRRALAQSRRTSPSESDIATALRERGAEVLEQMPVGRYNLDLAIMHARPVAVEVFDTTISEHAKTTAAQRLKDISGAGFACIYVLTYLAPGVLRVSDVADRILAFAQAVSGDKAAEGQYGVIGCDGKPRTTRRLNLDHFPRVEGF